MLNKPENYTEAKKIIEDAVENDHERHKLMVSKLRAMLVMGLGIGAAVGAGVVTQDPMIGTLALPPAMMVAAPFTLPYFLRKRTIGRIHNGEYFQDKSEAEIMEIAQRYVDGYNELEEKGKIK